MAGDHAINFETVCKACETLVERGEKVSNRRVREEIGSGSMTTITRFVREWQHEQSAPSRFAALPDDFLKTAKDAILSLWDAAEQVSGRETTVLLEQLLRQQRANEEHVAQLEDAAERTRIQNAEYNAELEMRLAVCAEELSEAREETKNETVEKRRLEALQADLHKELAVARKEYSEASAGAEAARAKLLIVEGDCEKQLKVIAAERDEVSKRVAQLELENAVLQERVRSGLARQQEDQKRLDQLMQGRPAQQSVL